MTVIVFADIDDSLIASTRTPPCAHSLEVARCSKNKPCGYLTPVQKTMLDWLAGGASIVPVTARSYAGLSRVRLPVSGYSITTFGAFIVDQSGQSIAAYQQEVVRGLEKEKLRLVQLLGWAEQLIEQESFNMRIRLVNDFGLDCFISIKHNEKKQNELLRLHGLLSGLLPTGWTAHLNANNIALYPPAFSKEAAVRYYMEHYMPQHAISIGLGDSLTDLGFMRLCNYSMTPARCQVMDAISQLP